MAKKSTTVPAVRRLPRAQRPPPAVTREEFLAWRSPREGAANPEQQTNPVWSWLARNPELTAWSANAHFGGPSSFGGEPGWCNQRFGQSRTALPDGRALLVAGEHEDHYDPDFYIYNDVIVVEPDGSIELYGYPRAVFPPTDFHSATLLDDRVLLVGCLGYPAQRRPGVTPVFALDVATLAITPVATTGEAPGWIFRHTAALAPDGRALVVRGGERSEREGDAEVIRESIDDWELALDAMVWRRLTARRWPLWELRRVDGARNQLMTIGWMPWNVAGRSPFDDQQLATLGAQIGRTPDFDTYRARYSPPVPHARVEDDDATPVGTTRIVVEGVTVRYVEHGASVEVTIEGELPTAVVAAIVDDARQKLSTVERAEYAARCLRG